MIIFNQTINTYVVHKSTGSTFIIKNRSEVLDITLASSTLLDQVSSWRLLDEHSFSDYRYIEIHIMDKCISAKRTVNLSKTNFDYYKKLIEKGLAHFPLINQRPNLN